MSTGQCPGSLLLWSAGPDVYLTLRVIFEHQASFGQGVLFWGTVCSDVRILLSYLYLRECLIRARSGLSVTAVHARALHLVFCVVICDYHSALMGNSGSVYCRALLGEFCLTGKILTMSLLLKKDDILL